MKVAYRKAFVATAISLIANPTWAELSILPNKYSTAQPQTITNGRGGSSPNALVGVTVLGATVLGGSTSSSTGSVAATVLGGSSSSTGSVAATVLGGSSASTGSVAATVLGGSTGFSGSSSSTGSVAATVLGGSSASSSTGSVAATVLGGSTGFSGSSASTGSVAATVLGGSSASSSTGSVAATVAGGSTGRASSTGSVAATVLGGSSSSASTGSVAATVLGGSSSSSSTGSVAATVLGGSSSSSGSSSVAATVAGGSTGRASSTGSVAATVLGGSSSSSGSSSVAATVLGGSSSSSSTGSVAATVLGGSSSSSGSSSVAATVAGGSTGRTSSTGSVAATVVGGSTGFTNGGSSVAATVAGGSTSSSSTGSVAATVIGGSTGFTNGGSSSVAATVAGGTTGQNNGTVAATVAATTGQNNNGTIAATVAATTGHNNGTVAATVAGNSTGQNNGTVAATVAATTGQNNNGTIAATVAATTGHNTNGTVAATVAATTGQNNNGTVAATVAATTGQNNNGTVAATVAATTGQNNTVAATVAATTGQNNTVAATVAATTGQNNNTVAATVAATTGQNNNTVAATVAATTGQNNATTGFNTTGANTTGSNNTTGFTTGESVSTATVSTSTASTSSASTSSASSTSSAATSSTSSTSSSTTGSSSSSSSSSTSSSTSATTGFKQEEKNKLRTKLEPLFHLSFDFGSYIVNLTPQISPPQRNIFAAYENKAVKDSLVYGDYRDGFQKTVYGSVEVGLGVQLKFWFENATGLRNSFWAYIGVLPVVGKDTQSSRYVSTLDKAYAIGGRNEIPESASDLDRWDAGDSITYAGHGGVIFNATAGLGPVGVGTARLAKGTWETYIEKVGSNKVYVKMTSGKLEALSVFGSVSIFTISQAYFNSADDGFSYLFDLSTDTGRKAYEDMIRGNAYAADKFATEQPRNLVEAAPVQKVMTFRSVSTGSVVSKAFAIPIIWDKTYSTGRVQSFTTSDLHMARNTARVHYGIFSSSEDSRFWFKHKEKDFMFYGAKYSVDNWDTKAHMESMFGSYNYAYRNEKSNASRLRDGINELVRKTGLDALMVGIPDRGDLGYTGVEFNVLFNDANTLRLMMAAQKMSESQFVSRGGGTVLSYFKSRNDPYTYCNNINNGPHQGEADQNCMYSVQSSTNGMMSKMYNALKRMYKTMNSDPRAFSAAYGEFGEAMNENAFTFKAAMDMAGPGAIIEYTIEGTKISMYYRQWQTDAYGRWIPVSIPTKTGLPFDPKLRRSKARGVVIGNNPGDVVNPFIEPVSM